MANVQQFSQYSTNPSSILFDGFLTYNPPPNPVIEPDFSIVLGTNNAIALANGIITLQDAADINAAGTKSLKLDYWRIRPGSVKGVQPSTAQVKIVDLQTVNTDYAYSNVDGRSQFFAYYYDDRETVPYTKDYSRTYPALANKTYADRTTALIAQINADGSAPFTATAINGASGSGSGQTGGGIRLTGKVAGQDWQVAGGDGFSPIVTEVQASKKEFGTSLFLQTYNIPAYAGAYSGKTFKTVLFSIDIAIPLAQNGQFKGNSVANNAHAFESRLVAVFFEVGAGDASLTAFDAILAGTSTPTSKYLGKSQVLGL